MLAGTLIQTIAYLEQQSRPPSVVRTVIESTISTIQALISLTDSSVASAPCGALTVQAVESNCVQLLCKSALVCLPALLDVQVSPKNACFQNALQVSLRG